MSTKKQIQRFDWSERLQTFSSTNIGRSSPIASDDTTIVENKALVSVNYNPLGKGNDVVITVNGFFQMINDPVDLYITEESNGIVSTIEIVEQMGRSTLLRLL